MGFIADKGPSVLATSLNKYPMISQTEMGTERPIIQAVEAGSPSLWAQSLGQIKKL